MQANIECMKDILRYIIKNTKVKIDSDDFSVCTVSVGVLNVISALSKDEKYGKEEVAYNMLKCHKNKLINDNIPTKLNECIASGNEIYDITFKGEKFLNDEVDLIE